jgi:hypothetical protein
LIIDIEREYFIRVDDKDFKKLMNILKAKSGPYGWDPELLKEVEKDADEFLALFKEAHTRGGI